MRDILICIDAMGRIGVAHRDIKPANVLMCHTKDDNGIAVKVGDFGMATFVGHGDLLRGRCGTPGEQRMAGGGGTDAYLRPLFSFHFFTLSLVLCCNACPHKLL